MRVIRLTVRHNKHTVTVVADNTLSSFNIVDTVVVI